jgi:hypothetical protein
LSFAATKDEHDRLFGLQEAGNQGVGVAIGLSSSFACVQLF